MAEVTEIRRKIPTPAVVETFLAEVDRTLAENSPAWLPCLKDGCCDGQAGCCQHSLNASIPWTEAEQIWLAVKEMPVAQRRKIAATAAEQVRLAVAVDPELFAALEKNEQMAADGLQRLNKVMASVESHPCPLLGVPATADLPERPYSCSVYERRPAICRYFGQCAVQQMTGVTEDGKPVVESSFMGCDLSFTAVKDYQEAHPNDLEVTLASGSTIANYSNRLAAPSINGMQTPLSIKPIPFWLADLTDPSGDITNPNNIFMGMRRLIEQTLEMLVAPTPPASAIQ